MQVCLSTSTMPSSRRNEAPVGHTSTQGGSAQCWHMSGSVCAWPVCWSRRFTLRIHCASVAGRPWPDTPFSSWQAVTQSSQSTHLVMSISSPQRCSTEAASSRRARLREFDQPEARGERRAGDGGGAPAQELRGARGSSGRPAGLALAQRRMALETIDLHRRVGVTARTEAVLAEHAAGRGARRGTRRSS